MSATCEVRLLPLALMSQISRDKGLRAIYPETLELASSEVSEVGAAEILSSAEMVINVCKCLILRQIELVGKCPVCLL